MHPYIKKIIKKNSRFAILGVALQVIGIFCLILAAVGTVRDFKGSVKQFLDEHTED